MKKTGKSSNGGELHYSAGVIIECKGRYLMMDRRIEPLGFACPAGHIDEGEEPKAAAIREVFEETGIKLKDVEFILEEEVLWNLKNNASHYWYLYGAKIDSEAFVRSDREAKSMAWYRIEEIKKLDLEPVWKYWFEKLKMI